MTRDPGIGTTLAGMRRNETVTIKKRFVAISAFVLALALGVNFAAGQSGYDLYQQALENERAEGKLPEAIQLYQRIIKNFAKDRALTAKALLQLGICYQKQGNAEARKTFERLMRDYGDQTDIVAQARLRLDGLASEPSSQDGKNRLLIRNIDLAPDLMPGAFSPDGALVALENWVGAKIEIFDLATGKFRVLTQVNGSAGESAVNPHWSPDGSKVAYEWSKGAGSEAVGELRVIGSDGSGERKLYGGKWIIFSLCGWFPDSKSLLVRMSDPGKQDIRLVRIFTADGSIAPIKNGVPNARFFLSPDGRFIATGRLVCFPVSGGEEIKLFTEEGDIKVIGWDPQARSILFTSDRSGSMDLWRLPIQDGKPHGNPELIKADIGNIYPLGGLTRKGSFLYALSRSKYDISIAAVDLEKGRVLEQPVRTNTTHIGASAKPAWSPDGQYLAWMAATSPAESFFDGYSTLCIRSERDHQEKQFRLDISLGPFLTPFLTWSSDSKYIFGAGDGIILRTDVATGNQSTAMKLRPGDALFDWSADGKVAFVGKDCLGGMIQCKSIVAYNAETLKETTLCQFDMPTIVFGGRGRRVSPDGKWLVLGTGAGKIMNNLLISTSGGPARLLMETPQQRVSSYWTPDSKRLLYSLYTPRLKEREGYEISVEGGNPRKLEEDIAGRFSSLSIHPDGKRIAFVSTGRTEYSYWVMENLPPIKAAK